MRYSACLPVVLLCAFSAYAQVPENNPAPDSKNAPDSNTSPGAKKSKKKTRADGKTDEVAPGAAVVSPEDAAPGVTAQPATPEYAGPGTLGRNFSIAPANTKSIRFRPYVGVSAILSSGLTGGQLNPDGSIANVRSYGVEGDFGISGVKVRAKDELSLDYHGNFYHYAPQSNYDGTNNVLSFGYTRQLRPHTILRFDDSAALYSNNFGVATTAATTDISIGNTTSLVTPSSQILDNRTIYASTAVDLVQTLSSRLTLDFGGSAFIVRRESSSLYGSIGEQARGDIEYRVTRRSTVGVYYGFTHYEFSKAFGGSNIHTLGLSYSVGITRNLEVRVRGGASRIESLGLSEVALDPLVALLVGHRTGQVALDRVNIIPDVSAQVVRRFNHATAGAEASLSVSPGNGLVLTSKRTFYNAHLDYTGLRTYSITMGATREQLAGVGNSFGTFASNGANFGVSREIKHGLQANFRSEYRHYDITSVSGFARNQYKLALGLTYSPGERPLSIW